MRDVDVAEVSRAVRELCIRANHEVRDDHLSALRRARCEELSPIGCQVLDALLENVVAHTPEGTPFAVRLTRSADGARLAIADDGRGIPAATDVRGRSDRGSTRLGHDIHRRWPAAACSGRPRICVCGWS